MQKPTALILSIITVLSRLIPHPANFTALGAGSLFSGAKINRPWNYLLPLAVLTLTDLIIGLHGTMIFVYSSVAAAIWMGEKTLSKNPNTSTIATVAVANSAIFFLVTNFGVWLTTAMYPKTFPGLIESYVMGLPFWRNMMVADVVFTVGFFLLYGYASNRNIVQSIDKKIKKYVYIRGGFSL